MYVVGKTGMGKTNLIKNMAIQDIRAGRGVGIIDPHGELAEECLKAVPSRRIGDVIYFNPCDREFPVGFNLLDCKDPKMKHLVASGVVGVFQKIWASSWGVRLENTLRHAVLSLLEYPDATLLGVLRVLVDEKYREKIIDNEKDPIVRMFWVKQFREYAPRFRVEVVESVQNKVSQFLANSLMRNILAQPRSAFDIREVMDSQKILIVNLAKGKIGDDNSALLGAMLISKMQMAALGRADIPENRRKDFYLYVDEFQNFATQSFATILSEARKYRLNLILAHQYISQLDEEVQNAVFGNVGTLATFRVGPMDTEVLRKMFAPTFADTDLMNLDKYHLYVKLMIDGVASDPFSAISLEPFSLEDTRKNVEKIIRSSRERYGTARKAVEKKISRLSGMG
jgi:DNA helicase HerA-like ATPase